MALAICLMLQDSLTLRAVPRALKRFFSYLPSFNIIRTGSHTTLSRWIKRVGLYKLLRPLEKADDWTLLADHSIMIGAKKCLLILGVRLTTLKACIKEKRALCFEDVEPILIEFSKTSNGTIVNQALKRAEERIGKTAQICSDLGPDLYAGIRSFQEDALKKDGRKVNFMPDISHKIASLLKEKLEENEEWKGFVSKAAKSKLKFQLSEAAHLCSPNQRSKARFMNLDELVRWGKNILNAFKNESDKENVKLLKKFAWVKDYEAMILEISELLLVAGITRHKIRTEYVTKTTYSKLEKEFFALKLSHGACQFVGELLDFIEKFTADMKEGEIFLGSSEILESLFGKLKNLIYEDAKRGFTPFALSAAACLGKLDVDVVQQAIGAVSDKQVKEWCLANIGETFISLRRRLFKLTKKSKAPKITSVNNEVGHNLAGIIEERLEAA
jgi:hypothetical protein